MSLSVQIRRYIREFVAIAVLLLVAGFVGVTILRNQRFLFPWEDFYVLTAEFRSAGAVTPGQGQTVTVAGVKVGDISRVELRDGRARVSMKIEKRYAPIYRDARMLLRPKTGLKDMSIQLDPGTRRSGAIPAGGLLPASRTEPDVNPDEVLSVLDADTRHYLKLTIAGLGEGLEANGRALRRLLQAGEPTLEHTARVMGAVADRRRKLARLVHNLNRVAEAAGERDEDIAAAIDASAATFESLARQDAAIRDSLTRFPATLAAGESALRHSAGFAEALRPAARALRPSVRELPAALRTVRPLLRDATPILRDRIRPLVREAIPVLADARPAAADLVAASGPLDSIADDAVRIVNELLYNPAGSEEGYLFYALWFAHNAASLMSTEDAHGVHWRGQAIASCSTIQRLQEEAPGTAALFGLPLCPEEGR